MIHPAPEQIAASICSKLQKDLAALRAEIAALREAVTSLQAPKPKAVTIGDEKDSRRLKAKPQIDAIVDLLGGRNKIISPHRGH